MNADDPQAYNSYLDKLSDVSGRKIDSLDSLLEAVDKRHAFFHENNCRLSDHGIEEVYAEDYTEPEIKKAFKKIRDGEALNRSESIKLKSALLYEFARMNFRRGWVQQFHIGPIRNNNSRMFESAGPNIGFDSIGGSELAKPLAKFMDRLDSDKELTKTVIYNINPRDNAVFATMAGNFPGKMQYGPAWWFLDHKNGIEQHINDLSNYGLLGRFIGMTTDSRSLLSFPRHEYFRRILCNIIGGDMEKGEIPNDFNLTGAIVKNICFDNARNYFGLEK